MPSIFECLRSEYLAQTLPMIIFKYEERKLYIQIGDYLKLSKSTVTSILYCHNRQPKHLLQPTRRVHRLFKLHNRAKRVFICHIKQNPYNNHKPLSTSSKSGLTLFLMII